MKPAAILLLIVAAGSWAGALPGRAADFGLTDGNRITDQGGRQRVVRQPFGRIISLYGAHTENLFALGLDREIIGVTRHESHPPAARRKPVFSYHDDPEKFLAARPDLVLVRPMIDRGYRPLMERLEKSGIAVVSLQPGTIQEMYAYWEILGVLGGRKAQAAALTERFRQAVAAFAGLADRVETPKRVFFEAIHSKMKTFSPDSMPIFALETAGGINLAADAPPVRDTNIAAYGTERVLSHAAELDFYLAQQGVMNPVSRETITATPGFAVLKAVRENAVFLVDETIVARPTPRLLLGIAAIGRILYPSVFEPSAAAILRAAGLDPH
ncbi:MAG: ABC transporter substrate-binding protein [Desulfobacteraceae bacterium]|nr:ABC transporter substrate-binding protein [Desulfobacteraceae bacterium]